MRLHSCSTLSVALCVAGALVSALRAQDPRGLQSKDLHHLRSVGEVQLSPNGLRVAYSVLSSEEPGRPSSQVWIMTIATKTSVRLGGEGGRGSRPRWSPDGRSIAYFGRIGDSSGVVVARADGSAARLLATTSSTNHPLPSSGEHLAWSPDGRKLAYVSATPGPEADANGDPMLITRYLYKPTASEGLTRFNDNRRIHIFTVDVASRAVRQLTKGDYYEHSIAWSPSGAEILFISNHAPDPDRFFNYDIFAVNVANSQIRRLTDTKSAEYLPEWSPDGKRIAYLATKRPLTSSETTMEDTHVWLMSADGNGPRELAGMLDRRQGGPQWAPDGSALYFTAQERGSTHLYRLPLAGGAPERVTGTEPGSVGSWSIGKGNAIAYTYSTPGAPAELYVKHGATATALTTLNKELLAARTIASVDSMTFRSFDGTQIQAFLTKPLGMTPTSRHPMIVMIHGGPHGQQGPAFNSKAQAYASHGYATLMVNYRGSTGYGQELTDAIFGDQNGGEAKDVLAGVDAAIARYPWIDADRLGVEGGSYGGQLTNWLITQTDRFKAAVPSASISNLVSFNYMSYYHDYLAVEFGAFPHEKGLMDTLWTRSPIRYVSKVKTPTMLLHGENDNDVPIAEAEQFFVALRDVGVEAVMVRYPREGHGIRETKHAIDVIDRSIRWYDRHFTGASAAVGRPMP